MSWTPLAPHAPVSIGRVRAAVTAGTSAGGNGQVPKIGLILRASEFPDLAWLAPGETVELLFGGGEHAGMLRITPRGPHRLGQVALAKPRGSLIGLRVPLVPGLAPGKRASVPVEFDFAAAWIEVTLPPAWGLRAAPAGGTGPTPGTRAAATSPERGKQLAAEAAAIARAKAGR